MKIDELIEELEKVREEHGNIEVQTQNQKAGYPDTSIDTGKLRILSGKLRICNY